MEQRPALEAKYLLSWSRIHPPFFQTQRIVNVFTRALCWSIGSAKGIKFTLLYSQVIIANSEDNLQRR
jgi:hypothetical protein